MAPEQAASTADPSTRRARRAATVGLVALVVVAAAVGVARLQLGPEPTPAEAVTEQPPPLLLPDQDAAGAPLGKPISALARGDHEAAERAFAAVLADDPSNAHAQVGLAIARWPANTQQALRLLTDATSIDPDDAWPWLNLGVGQALAFGLERAEPSLRRARSAGQRQRSAWPAARRADDVLHPDLAPGYPPLILEKPEIDDSPARADIGRLLRHIASDDRRGAAKAAAVLTSASGDETIATARILGRYDKDRHTIAVGELRDLVRRHGPNGIAGFHLGILHAWQGDVATARRLLAATSESWPGTQRAKVAAELLPRLQPS